MSNNFVWSEMNDFNLEAIKGIIFIRDNTLTTHKSLDPKYLCVSESL